MQKPIFYLGIFLATIVLVSGSVYVWEQYGMFEFKNSFFSQISSSFGGSDFKLVKQIPLDDQLVQEFSESLNFQTPSVSPCAFNIAKTPSRQNIIISEVAWMGTINSANDEWIELKNISDKTFDISGWQLFDKDEQIKIVFPVGVKIKANGFFVLGRGEERNDIPVDYLYTGNLRNSDEGLRLFDGNCNLIDEVLAGKNWPAGDNKTKATMERNLVDLSWHTSGIVGGTPKKENSIPVTSSTSQASPTFQTSPTISTTSPLISTTTTITTSTTSIASTSTIPITLCSQENLGRPSYSVLINEVAWMGIASNKVTKEWIELKNNSNQSINLNNWQLLNKTANIKIVFNTEDILAPGAYYLLERSDDDSVPDIKADKIFTNAIKNSNESLRLFNEKCELVDEVLADVGADKTWPGGTTSPDYRTLERTDINSWHTYSGSGVNGIFGTPKALNSVPAIKTSSSQGSTPSLPPPLTYYTLAITKAGDGTGLITSEPSGINCGVNCGEDSEDYVSGTSINLTATPSSDSSFQGWAGGCSGTGDCAVVMRGNISVSATFSLIQTSSSGSGQSSPSSSLDNILISEIMAGNDENANYEFIELYNPTSNPVDLTGWSIKKRSSTGTESSLVVSSRLEGKIIPAGGYFLLANQGGYSGSVLTDVVWPSSYTLAYTNNAIILYNASGEKIEEVNWLEIPRGQSYERISWDGNQFQVQANPNPQNSQNN